MRPLEELDPRRARAQLLPDSVLKIAYAPRMTREEIVRLLADIR